MIDFHTHARGTSAIAIPECCKGNKAYSFYGSRFYEACSKLLPENLTRDFFALGLLDVVRSKPVMEATRPFYRLALKEIDRLIKSTTIDALLGSMGRGGIEKAVVLAIEPYVKTDDLLAVTNESTKLYVFGSVDMTASGYAEEAERVIRKPIRGFKFHAPMQLMDAGDRRMHEVMEVLSQKNGMPVLFDTGYFPSIEGRSTDIREMEWLIRDFPDLPIVFGHTGKEQHEEAIRLAMKYGNAFVETSWQPWWVIREAVKKLGAEKVLLGSDFPALRQGLAVKMARIALKDSELEKVSSTNAKKLLGI